MLDILKVAVGFVNKLKVGEGIVIFRYDLLEIVELMLVDNADQDRPLGVGISADGVDLRAAVVQLLGDLRNKFVFVGSDDGELVCRLGGFQQQITNKGGNKAIQNTKRHRLIVQIVLRIDENRSDSNDGIQRKGDDEEIGVRADFVNIAGDDIRTAGGGVVSEAYAVDHACQHTAEDHGVDCIVIKRVVLHKCPSGILKEQECKGIYQREQQGFYCKILLHQEIGQHRQRHIDQQRHKADAEAGFVLDHGCNTVNACRCKVIGNDEYVVDKCQQNRAEDNLGVIPYFFHITIPFVFLFRRCGSSLLSGSR